jgi:hypothetical protein
LEHPPAAGQSAVVEPRVEREAWAMKVALGSVELDDATRRLIGAEYGYSGPAPRDVCRRAIVANGTGWPDQLAQDADDARAELVADPETSR